MRVLHLIDPSGPGGGACTLKLAADVLASAPEVHHVLLVIGNARHAAQARRCGLEPRGRLGAPLNRPALALGALRGLLRSEERTSGSYDLVHAWTLTSAVAALRAGARRVLVTAAAAVPLDHADRRRLRRAEVLGLGPGAVRRLAAAGVPVRGALPAVADRGAIDFDQRPLLRQEWGADETCFVVGLLGDPPGAADGESAISAAGRAALAGRDVRLILHHESAPPGGMRRWLRKLRLGHLVVADDRMGEPWRVAAGLDAAIFAPRRAPVRGAARWWSPPGLRDPWRATMPPTLLPLAWAMAAGVPVIGARVEGLEEFLDDGANALLHVPGDFNAASAAILDLFGDHALRRRLGAAARRRIEGLRPESAAAQLIDAYWGGVGSAIADANAPRRRIRLQSQMTARRPQ